MTDQISLVAKLLANENINVLKANISTAAFDIKNRTLVLPQWGDMTDEIEQMLVAHEIGHALWTNELYYQALKDKILDFPHAQEYLNILEDVRVERLCKLRYPGIRKTFHEGYTQLAGRDFFGIKGKALDTLSFPDRINLHFKLGSYAQIPFSAEEKRLVVRAERTETLQDVIALAQDVYDLCKDQAQNLNAKLDLSDLSTFSDNTFDNQGFDDFDQSFSNSFDEQDDFETDLSDDFIDQKDLAANKNNSDDQVEFDDVSSEPEAPTTNKAFDENLQQLANSNIKYRYWKIAPFQHNPIISYNRVFKYLDRKKGYTSHITNEYLNHFKNETNSNVSYLVKEFEMKKAASEYKRTQVSKTGILDTKKLWSYKISDDLFKQIQVVKSGKNHGMIFLLDWSSSMCDVIDNTLKQLINLVTFCKRIQIPFQVLAFSNYFFSENTLTWRKSNVSLDSYCDHGNTIDPNMEKLGLIEIFSHTMSGTEFNRMVEHIVTGRFKFTFFMNGTPLNAALAFMYEYIEKFQATYNVEKMSFVALTDGASSEFEHLYSVDDRARNEKHFVVANNKNYPFYFDGLNQTSMLLDMIKDRYDCTMIGFFLARYNRYNIFYAIRSIYPSLSTTMLTKLYDCIRSNMKSTGVHVITDVAYDELYLIKSDNMKITADELHINKNLSAAGVATQFGKHLKSQKNSRVILQKFIEQIA